MPASPPLPPQGWETAGLLKVGELSRDVKSKAWLHAEVARLPAGVNFATPDKAREMLALASAQIRYWRDQAARQEARYAELQSWVGADLKSRMDADLLATARRLAGLQLASGKPQPEPAWYREELKWSWDKAASRVCGYNWLAPAHRGPVLRRVLCYEKSQFGRLVRDYRLRPSRRGREDIFTCRHALQLLAHRLKPRTRRSREIAQRIWGSVAMRSVTWKAVPVEFVELRGILERTGFACAVGANGRPDLTEIDHRLGTDEAQAGSTLDR